MLNTRPSDLIEMRVGDQAMFMAQIGQKQDQIAVSIEEYIEPESVEEPEWATQPVLRLPF